MLPELYSFAPEKIQGLALRAAANGWKIGVAASGSYWVLTLIDAVAYVSIHADIKNEKTKMSYFSDCGIGQKKVSKDVIDYYVERKAYL